MTHLILYLQTAYLYLLNSIKSFEVMREIIVLLSKILAGIDLKWIIVLCVRIQMSKCEIESKIVFCFISLGTERMKIDLVVFFFFF